MKNSAISFDEIINNISENPLVSVIIPVYKVKEHLGKCIDGVINQSYKNLEIILVDDGTPDESSIICEEYLLKDERIVLAHKDNAGLGYARNTGMDIMSGDYYTFLDSDDYIHKDYVLVMLAFAMITNSDITCSKLKITDSKNEDVICHPEEISYYCIDGKTATMTFDYKVTACGKLYKTRETEKMRFSPVRIHEDDDSYYRFAYCSKNICIADFITYYYYQSSSSITRTGKRDSSLEYLNIYEKRINYFEQRKEQTLVDGSYDRLCMVIALNYISYKKNKTNVSDYEYLLKTFKDSFNIIKHSKNLGFCKKAVYGLFEKFPNIITFFAIILHIR